MAKKGARQGARQLAMQGLYAYHIAKNNLSEIETDLLTHWDAEKPLDREYFHRLLMEIPKVIDMLSTEIYEAADRRVGSVTPVEQAILWVGLYELQHCLEVPAPVIINECIELAKEYGAQNSHKFINRILDARSKVLRPSEPKPKSDT